MLADDQLELLTAAVDGELAPAEADALRGLLAESSEARRVLAQLQAHADRLRGLPRLAPPADLRTRVMAKIAAQTPRPMSAPATPPTPAPRPTPARRTPSWVPLAVAAGLLLAVTAGSFWFFAQQDDAARVAGVSPGGNPDTGPTAARGWADALPADHAPLTSAPVPRKPDDPVARADGPRPGPESLDVPPRPVHRDPVLAAPPLAPAPPLELIQVRVPFLAPVADLDREDSRRKLADELGRDPAFRVDLFAKDPARGAELVQAAAKAAGLTVHADAAAADRIKRKQPATFALYTEALTPAEVADLLVKLAAADGKSPARVLDTLHVTPALAADQRELKDLLGFDPGPWKKPQPAPEGGPKPLSAGTGDMITRALTNPPGKPGEKPAVLLTFGPPPARTPPAASKELKLFAEKRGDRRPNTLAVLIVIRVGG